MRAAHEETVPNQPGDVCGEAGVAQFTPAEVCERPSCLAGILPAAPFLPSLYEGWPWNRAGAGRNGGGEGFSWRRGFGGASEGGDPPSESGWAILAALWAIPPRRFWVEN